MKQRIEHAARSDRLPGAASRGCSSRAPRRRRRDADGRGHRGPAGHSHHRHVPQRLVHVGLRNYAAGRAGDFAATGLSEHLAALGFRVGRLKTGTCPRLDAPHHRLRPPRGAARRRSPAAVLVRRPTHHPAAGPLPHHLHQRAHARDHPRRRSTARRCTAAAFRAAGRATARRSRTRSSASPTRSATRSFSSRRGATRSRSTPTACPPACRSTCRWRWCARSPASSRP